MKAGELLWMLCTPGGVCLFIESRFNPVDDELIYKVYHPTMGYTEISAYYFDTVSEALKISLQNAQ